MARWATSLFGSFAASAWAWLANAPPISGAAKGSRSTRHRLEPTMSRLPTFSRLAGGRRCKGVFAPNGYVGQGSRWRAQLAGRADLLNGQGRKAGFGVRPIGGRHGGRDRSAAEGSRPRPSRGALPRHRRSEEHTSELQSLAYLVCR